MAEATNSPKAATAKKKTGGISKMDAVRQALRQLGGDAKPVQIHGFIKDKFGIEMTLDHISNYKSDIRKKRGKGKKAGHKPAATAAAPKATAPKAAGGNGRRRANLSVQEVDTLRRLLREVDPGSLKGMIDVLSR
jgi:hypothetical protein